MTAEIPMSVPTKGCDAQAAIRRAELATPELP
jgi:hypothetical protein